MKRIDNVLRDRWRHRSAAFVQFFDCFKKRLTLVVAILHKGNFDTVRFHSGVGNRNTASGFLPVR